MPPDKTANEDVRLVYAQLSHYAEDLQKTVRMLHDSQNELERAYIDTIRRLAQAVEYKDEETGNHIGRISYYSAMMAKYYGLPNPQIVKIFHAAPMHDVGKISIPDAILLKPARLTAEECAVMKTHTTAGASLLSNSRSSILETARIIALNHHEKWDGSGYPSGLKGKEIPIEGRIVCLADVYDALLSNRPYKPAFSIEKALRIIREERGKHFDPALIDLFFDNLESILGMTKQLQEYDALGITEHDCDTSADCPLLHKILQI